MQNDHALLSPSGAKKWLTCTPSAQFETEFEDTTSEAAKEGTVAHSVGELILQLKLQMISESKYKVELKKLEKSEYYNEAMFDHCTNYAIYVMEKYYAASPNIKSTHIQLETKIDITEWVPEGFGTGDTMIVADGFLEMVDLKYGKGVFVEAEENEQLKTYALGALDLFSALYDIQSVRLHIYQPRLDNISSWEISVADLRKWGLEYLKPRAELAFKGEGEYVAGEHCRFCRGKGICRAYAEMNLKLAQYDFALTNRLTPEEVADILEKATPFDNWIKGVKEYALSEAQKGTKWPGYKLVEGRSNRKYNDENIVLTLLKKLTFKVSKITKPAQLLGLGELEKIIGKDVFQKHVDPLLIKPPGAPTLVPQSDKRPELNTTEAAAADFKEVEIE